jgi:hypothetical protein
MMKNKKLDAFERFVQKQKGNLKVSPVDNGESSDFAVLVYLNTVMKAYKRLKNKP